MTQSDAPCIIDAWWRGAHDCASLSWCPPHIFSRAYRAYISQLVERERVRVLVAASVDDESNIMGWLAGDESCVHWVYVKTLYRRATIARGLILCAHSQNATQNKIVASHWSYACELPMRFSIEYRPRLFFTDDACGWMRAQLKERDDEPANQRY